MSAFSCIHIGDTWIKKQEIKAFWRNFEHEDEVCVLVGNTIVYTKEKVDDIARQMGLKRINKCVSKDGFEIDRRFLILNMVGPSILHKLYEMHGIKTVEELDKRIDEVTEKVFNNLIIRFKNAKKENDWYWQRLNKGY